MKKEEALALGVEAVLRDDLVLWKEAYFRMEEENPLPTALTGSTINRFPSLISAAA